MIEKIDILAEEWADFVLRCFERSPIGYPKGMAEESNSSGVPGSLCPEVIMRPRIEKFDRAYKAMKDEDSNYQRIIDKKYKHREKLTNRDYELLHEVHVWVRGYFRGNKFLN